jgi:hypothetical protein
VSQRIKFVIAIALIASSVAVLVYTAVDQTKMYMLTVGAPPCASPAAFVPDR